MFQTYLMLSYQMNTIDCSPIVFTLARYLHLDRDYLMDVSSAFAKALKICRKKKGLTQEDFGTVSSRTYISSLERELKSPTLDKIHEISKVIGVSPMTLLCLTYYYQSEANDLSRMLAEIEKETSLILKGKP